MSPEDDWWWWSLLRGSMKCIRIELIRTECEKRITNTQTHLSLCAVSVQIGYTAFAMVCVYDRRASVDRSGEENGCVQWQIGCWRAYMQGVLCVPILNMSQLENAHPVIPVAVLIINGLTVRVMERSYQSRMRHPSFVSPKKYPTN